MIHQQEPGYRSQLGRVRGLGAGHRGTHHWWLQRLTAIGLVPLGLWLLYAIMQVYTLDYAATVQWMAHPLHATLMLATVWIGLYHGLLGVQIIIEDYVHGHLIRLVMIFTLRLIIFILAIAALVAIFTCIGARV
jgi:succinate dehydrogenase / fumarate reductase membrane anchor subunit